MLARNVTAVLDSSPPPLVHNALIRTRMNIETALANCNGIFCVHPLHLDVCTCGLCYVRSPRHRNDSIRIRRHADLCGHALNFFSCMALSAPHLSCLALSVQLVTHVIVSVVASAGLSISFL